MTLLGLLILILALVALPTAFAWPERGGEKYSVPLFGGEGYSYHVSPRPWDRAVFFKTLAVELLVVFGLWLAMLALTLLNEVQL